MKTIKERAKEWGEHIVETTPYDVVDGKACVFVEDRNIADVAEESYVAGATEQKVIDDLERTNQALMGKGSAINYYEQGYHDAIENACYWLDAYLMEIGYPDDWLRDSPNIESGKERFKKAMAK